MKRKVQEGNLLYDQRVDVCLKDRKYQHARANVCLLYSELHREAPDTQNEMRGEHGKRSQDPVQDGGKINTIFEQGPKVGVHVGF